MILSAGSSQRDVVSGVEDNASLSQNGVVLDFGFADGRTVVGEDDEPGLSGSEGSEGGFVTKDVLTALDDQTELAVDVVRTYFLSHLVVVILNIN